MPVYLMLLNRQPATKSTNKKAKQRQSRPGCSSNLNLHQRQHSLNRDASRPAAARPAGLGIPLNRHHDIVVASQSHIPLRPLIEMRLGRYRSSDPLLGPHRPILLKGPRPLDRRLVHARALEYLKGALVGGEVALGGPRLVGREVAVRVEDVVLDQGVARPAVHAEVARACGVVGASVLDGAVAVSRA
jgi:hypothetical protein